MRTPLLQDMENSLQECELNINVYRVDSSRGGAIGGRGTNAGKGTIYATEKIVDELIGSVKLSGKELIAAVGTQGAVMKWYSLTSGEAGSSLQNKGATNAVLSSCTEFTVKLLVISSNQLLSHCILSCIEITSIIRGRRFNWR